MKRRLTTYLKEIDRILAEEEQERDYEELAREHLVQIGFFMHERLVHLIVTLTFGLLAFATFFVLLFQFSVGLLVLFAALLVLLIPYIAHYYLLENGVQKMYQQYDKIKQIYLRSKQHDSGKSTIRKI